VGITEYREDIKVGNDSVFFPKLSACTTDADKIQAYLNTDTFYEPHIKTLYNQQATKAAIAQAITQHLGQARDGDVAFFYFSGHGTQEFAEAALFPAETDNRLECLACYYDDSLKNDFLLANKELRWLIKTVSINTPHIVTVFDCCHSGENTKNVKVLRNTFNNVVEKKVTYTFPQRTWEQFLFSAAVKKEDLIGNGLTSTLPEGRHVQLSACESGESAVEIDKQSVFTRVLISVLNGVGGDLSYHSLNSRLRQYMRGVYDQKPTVYYGNPDTNTRYLAFLNKPYSVAKNVFGEITYNESREWQLNLGAIHGIRKDQPLEIFEADNATKTIKAVIGAVKIDHCEINTTEKLDENKVYFTNWEGLGTKAIRVHFDTSGANLQLQQAIFEELFTGANQQVIAEDDETNAQYVLRFLNDKYYLTLPNDRYRPLFAPLAANETDLHKKIAFCLHSVAAWESAKQLVNEDETTTIPANALTIEAAIGGTQYTPLNGNSIEIGYVQQQNGEWTNTLKIKLTNTTSKNLYIGCAHFTSDFGCFTDFLNPPVYQLTAGATVELNQETDNILPVSLSDHIKWYNWPAEHETIKLIVSSERFDETLLNIDGLTPPPTPNSERSASEGIVLSKGIVKKDPARV
ncbi:MAG TPA: caspase family protein, partial [Niastella sp.]|nr:caspase family protein [Niastella sp.]